MFVKANYVTQCINPDGNLLILQYKISKDMIQVINRALDILEYVAQESARAKSLTEVATAVQLNHGTCANIMKTMVNRQYLDQVSAKKGYCLGAKAYLLTGNPLFYEAILEAARPQMAVLTQHLKESCLLAVLQNDQRLLIHRDLCDQPLQVYTADEKHVFDSASGRLLIGMLNNAELEKFITRYGLPSTEFWAEADERQAFLTQIAKIRAEECAYQESVRQVIGYAVPIRKFGKVVAGLSVYLPMYRHDSSKATDVLVSLRQAAGAINQKLAMV